MSAGIDEEDGQPKNIFDEPSFYEHGDPVWNAYKTLSQEKREQLQHEVWDKYFADNPEFFFDGAAVPILSQLSDGERFYMLIFASNELQCRPSDFLRYVEHFPQDRDAIAASGPPATTHGFYLHHIAAPAILEAYPRYRDDFGMGSRQTYRQYIDGAQRKERAPEFVMDACKHVLDRFNTKDRYGDAAIDVFAAHRKAGDLANGFGGELGEVMDPSEMYQDAFEQLSEEEKSQFLIETLAIQQWFAVSDEVYNSSFHDDHVTQSKEGNPYQTPNVAHSILYQTYQPRRAYQMAQEHFEREAELAMLQSNGYDEYADHKLFIETLRRMGEQERDKEELVDTIVDFWDKNRNPFFANQVVETLSKLGPDRAAQQLLHRIKEKPEGSAALSMVLYRLEVGQLDISPEGVQYFDRLYDLGEHADPNFFAQRITVDGEVGLFDGNRTLQKYFSLGDLRDGRKKIQAEVSRLALSDLFRSVAPEGSTERKSQEEVFERFQSEYLQVFDDDFVEDTGIQWNNLSMREQVWFLQYASEAGEEEQERLYGALREFREPLFRSFAALELDQDAGEKILDIAESLDPADARDVFLQLGEIFGLLDQTHELIKNFFKKDTRSVKVSRDSIVREILVRGTRMITEAAAAVAADDQKSAIQNALNSFRVDVVQFGALFRGTFKGELGISLEEITGLDYKERLVTDLTDEEREEMLAISQANWLGRGAAGRGVYEEFRKTITEGRESQFRVLKKDDKVLSFLRFDPVHERDGSINPDRLYAGSFNVHPDYRGSAIGEAMLNQSLKEVAERYVIDATVHPGLAVGTDYVEKRGFNIVGLAENYDNSGETFFKLELDAKKNRTLDTRTETWTVDRVEQLFQSSYRQASIDEQLERQVGILHLDPERDASQVLEQSQAFISAGFRGTRYVTDPKDTTKRYYVFEKKTG